MNKLGVVILGFIAIAAAFVFFEGSGDFMSRSPLSEEDARASLTKKVARVDWRTTPVSGVSTLEVPVTDIAQTLPDIDTFPIVVNPNTRSNATVEIFVSTEKSGSGTDGWMVEAAQEFNSANMTTAQGERAQVRIRKIASGTGYQFIASGKYVPQGFSPSNAIWVEMAKSRGQKIAPVLDRTVGNIAGIVMKSELAATLRDQGQLNVPSIIDGVVQGRIVAGYSDPFASSTGLNFLITVLSHFAGGDETKILSPEAVSAFESFQASVPFVALTTLQMRDSVRRDGSLDAFVMEWQTFTNTDELRSGYEFIPFGWPHDNPLVSVGEMSVDQSETLQLFGAFLADDERQADASRMGFNPAISHTPPANLPGGDRLISAQKTWKLRKDSNRPIAAMFVADVSGSMEGERINGLRRALLDGSGFISPENAIGLIEFSTRPRLLLPIKEFTALQNAAFQTAAKRMVPNGSTAMYDAIAVALDQLLTYRDENPTVRPMIFVLTDGHNAEGMELKDLSRVIEGLGVPIHTIGFEADIEELQSLSSTVEAASVKANSEDVSFKIGSMFNSQM